ncbi:unnamed protein product, partial [Ixodes hexagonus]
MKDVCTGRGLPGVPATVAPSPRRQDETASSLGAPASTCHHLVGLQVIRSARSPPATTALGLAQSSVIISLPCFCSARAHVVAHMTIHVGGYCLGVQFEVSREEDSLRVVDGVAGAVEGHWCCCGMSWLGDFWMGLGGGALGSSLGCCCSLPRAGRFRSSARKSGLFQCGMGTASI